MRVRRLPALLLGLALLLTQWLSFAHALEHPALEPDKVCSICLSGLNLDTGAPLPASPAVTHWLQAEAPSAQAQTASIEAGPAVTRARGPPVFLD